MSQSSEEQEREVDLMVEAKCKKYACEFQFCLAKHNHNADRCRHHYDAFDRCARAIRQEQLQRDGRPLAERKT
jgi:hypothetical protein